MSHVTVETATVYRGGGRRFMTKRAAYRKAAEAEGRKTAGCTSGCGGWDYETGQRETCEWHGDPEREQKIRRRVLEMEVEDMAVPS